MRKVLSKVIPAVLVGVGAVACSDTGTDPSADVRVALTERPEFVEELAERLPFYRARHAVRPGITGWAQIQQSGTRWRPTSGTVMDSLAARSRAHRGWCSTRCVDQSMHPRSSRLRTRTWTPATETDSRRVLTG